MIRERGRQWTNILSNLNFDAQKLRRNGIVNDKSYLTTECIIYDNKMLQNKI